MRLLTLATQFLTAVLILQGNCYAQQLLPRDKSFVSSDSLRVVWSAGGATSYSLQIKSRTAAETISLTDTVYWVKHYQPFDTLSFIVTAYGVSGQIYTSKSEVYTANFARYPKLCLWLDPESVDTVAGGAVTSWNDKSTRGFKFVQPDATTRPVLKDNDGIKSVNFTKDFLSSPFYAIDSMKSTYVMLRHDGVTGAHNFILSKNYDGNAAYSLSVFNAYFVNFIDGINYPTGLAAGNKWQIISYRHILPNLFVTERNFRDSHSQTIAVDFSGTNTLPLTIGRNSYDTRHPYGGDISEIITFSESLNLAKNIFVKRYLSQKYFPMQESFDIVLEDRFCDTTLSLPNSYSSYLWSTGETTPTISVKSSGRYTVIVQNNIGELSNASFTVSYPQITLSDTSFCSRDSILLTTGLDSSKFDFVWSNGKTTPTIWVKTEDSFSVVVHDKFGCSKLSHTITVEENTFPETLLFHNDTVLCINNILTPFLENKSNYSFAWSSGPTDSSTIIISSGEYKLTVTDSRGCKAIDSVSVTVKGNAPLINYTSDTVCFGTTTSFTNHTSSVDSIESFVWSFAGDGVSSLQNPKHIFGNAGTKIVRLEVTTTSGCRESINQEVVVGEIPHSEISLVNGSFGCTSKPLSILNTSATLSDKIIAQKWSFGNGDISTAKNPTYTYPLLGNYAVSILNTTEYNCHSEASMPVSIFAPTGIPCMPILQFPVGDTALLNQTQQLRWANTCNAHIQVVQVSRNADFSQLLYDSILSPFASSVEANFPFGTFWWRVYTINSCKDTAVSVFDKFTIFKPELVSGMRLWLDASKGVETDEYGNIAQWKDQSSNAKHAKQKNIEQRPTYIESGLNSLPVVRFDGINDILVGQNLYVDEHNMSIFVVHKYDGKRTGAYQALITQQGDNGVKYRLYANANTNCKTLFGVLANSAMGVIETGKDFYNLSSIVSSTQTEMFSNGTLNTSGTMTNFIGIESEFVIGSHTSNSIAHVFSGDIAEIIIFDRALSAVERKKMDTYLLSKYQPAPIELGADRNIPYRLCPEILEVPSGYKTYSWNTGSIDNQISTVNPGKYSIATTSWFGIESSDSLVIHRPLFRCNDTAVCVNGAIEIIPGPAEDYSFQWSTGESLPRLTVAKSGIYSLTVTDTTGCTRTLHDFTVILDSFPVQASLGYDTLTLCEGQRIGLAHGVDEAVHYLWSDGSSESSYKVTQSELVTVTVTDKWQCRLLDTVIVTLQGYPISTAFTAINTCFTDTTEFTSVSFPYDSIAKLQWSIDGISVSQAPRFAQKVEQQGNRVVSLAVTSISGCISESVDTVFIKPKPSANFNISESCVNNQYRYTSESLAGEASRIETSSWNLNGEKIYLTDTAYHQFASTGPKTIGLKVVNEHGCADSISKIQSVVSNCFAPGNFGLEFPSDKAIVMDNYSLFEWKPSVNAYKYLIELSPFQDFSVIEYQDSSYATHKEVPVFVSGTHYWRVTAYNICGNKTVSGINSLERINFNTQSNVALWLKADAGITFSVDSSISVWTDQTAKGTVLAQTIVNSRPFLKENAINGMPAVSFNGISDQLKTIAGLGVSTTNMSVFIVSKFNEKKASNLNTIFSHRTSTGVKFAMYAAANTDNTLQYSNYPPEKEPITTVAYGMGGFKISSLVAQADSTFIYTNSKLSGRGKSETATGTDNVFIVGGFANNTLLNYGFSGEIAEIIILNTATSETERHKIENYLFNKYSTPLELGPDINYSLCDSVISAPDVYESYLWNTKLTGKNLSISAPGTYSLTVTDQLGMTWIDSVTVRRPFINNLHDSVFCAKDTVRWDLQMGADYLYRWSDGSAESNVNITHTSNVFAQVTDTLGCSVYSDTVSFQIDSFPVNSTIGADRSLCTGDYIFFENPVQKADTYQWASGSNVIYDIASGPGLYSLTATNTNGCEYKGSIAISIKGVAPSINVLVPAICENLKNTFSADVAEQAGDPLKYVSWKFGTANAIIGNSVEYSFGQSGKIPLIVNAETVNGCKASYYSDLDIQSNPSSSIAVTFGKIHCANAPVSISALSSSPASVSDYSWSFGKSGVSVTNTFSAPGKADIFLTATNSNGCKWIARDSLFIQNDLQVTTAVSLISPAHQDALLDTVVRFAWTLAANTKYYALKVVGADQTLLKVDSLTVASATLKIKTNQQYTWKVLSIGFCGDTAISAVYQFEKTDIEILKPTLWLDASSLNLLTGQYITKWGKSNTEQLTQSVLQLSPTLTDASSAINKRKVAYFDGTKYINGSPDFGIEQMATFTALVRIDSTAKLGMIISKGHTVEGAFSIAVAPNTNKLTIYADGAILNTAKSYYGWTLLTVQLKQDSVYFYADKKLEFAVRTSKDNKGVNSYPLTLGNSIQSANNFFKGAIAEVLAFDKFQTAYERGVIDKYLTAKYSASLDLPSSIVTTGFYPVTINAPASFRDYAWDTGITQNNVIVNSSGTYSLTATTFAGNRLIDSCTVIYPVVAQINDTIVCSGKSIVWDSKLSGGYLFNWFKNGDPLPATTSKLTINSAGIYQLRVTGSKGYVWTSKNVKVTVIDLAGSLDLGVDRNICKNELLEPVRKPDKAKTFKWDNGSSLAYNYALASKKYYLTVTDANGCTVSDSVALSIQGEAPSATLSFNDLCENTESRFAPTILGSVKVSKYNWIINEVTYTSDTVKAFYRARASLPIQLSLESTDNCKTTLFDTIAVLSVIDKSIRLFPGSHLCSGSVLSAMTQSEKVAAYRWSDGENKQASDSAVFHPIFVDAGSYSVHSEVVLDNGCAVHASASVTVQDSIPDAGIPQLTYPQSDINIFDKAINFKWIEGKAAYYQIQIAHNSSFATIIASVDSMQANTVRVELTKDSVYYWRIIAYNYCGGSVVSEIRKFSRFSIQSFNPVVWVDASQIHATDNTTVSSWGSPATHTFAQSDQSRQPLFHKQTSAIGNMPSVEFSGKTFMSGSTLLPLDSMQTVIALVENRLIGDYGMILSKQYTGNGCFTLGKNTGNAQFRFYVDDAVVQSTKTYLGWSLVCFTIGNNTVYSYFDDKLDAKTALVKDFKGVNNSPITLGKNSGANNYFFNGKVAELMVLPRGVSEEEYKLLASYFTGKYQVSINLPDTLRLAGFKSETISVASGFRQYEWSNGSADSAISVSANGIYRLTATDYFGRKIVDSVVVIVPQFAELIDSVLCKGDTIVWNTELNGNFSFVWTKDGAQLTASSSSLDITDAGRYQLKLIDQFGHSRLSKIHNIELRDIAGQLVLGNDTVICQNANFFPLSVPDKIASLLWSNTSVTKSIKIVESGTYALTVVDIYGCSATNSIVLSVEGLAADVSLQTSPVCKGTEVNLNSFVPDFEHSGITGFQWQIGDSILSRDTAKFIFADQGLIQVKITSYTGNGCSNTASATVSVLDVPEFVIETFPSEINCINQSFMLSIIYTDTLNVSKYSWSNTVNPLVSATRFYQPIFDSQSSPMVYLNLEYGNGCSRTENVQLNIVDSENVIMSKSVIVSPANKSFLYSDSILVKWTETGAAYYSVVLSRDSLRQQIITIADSLQITDYTFTKVAGRDIYIFVKAHYLCGSDIWSNAHFVSKYDLLSQNTALWLDASRLSLSDGAAVQSWGVGDGLLSQNNASLAPRFAESVYDIAGRPAVSIANKQYLEGMAGLSADSINTVFMLAQMPSSGTYQMMLSKGYSGEGSFTISKDNAVSKFRMYGDGLNNTSTKIYSDWNLLCWRINGNKGQLYVNGVLDTEMNLSKAIAGINTKPLTLGKDGGSNSYHYTGQIAEVLVLKTSVSDSDMALLTSYFRDKYTAELDMPDSVKVAYGFCSVSLSPKTGYKLYKWSTGETTASIQVSKSGRYALTATDFMGGIHTRSTYVQFPKTLTLSDTAFCFQNAIAINAYVGDDYSYKWSHGPISPNVNIDSTGNYSLTITDNVGCTKILGPMKVDIDFFAQESSLGPDKSVCNGNRIGLVSRAKGVTEYLWSDGSTEPFITITESKTVSLWAQNNRACQMRDTITVTVSGLVPSSNFSITGQCQGQTIRINSKASTDTVPITKYQWRIDGALYSGQSIETAFENPGIYAIKHIVSKADGCTDSTTVDFVVYTTPSVDFLPLQACEGKTVRFRPVNLIHPEVITSYEWQKGSEISDATQTEYLFDTAGTYSVMLIASTDHDCRDTAIHAVEIKASLKPQFIYSAACKGETAVFFNKTVVNPTNPIVEGKWIVNGLEHNSIENYEHYFSNAGSYKVELSLKTVNGCVSVFSEDVMVTDNLRSFIRAESSCEGGDILLSCDSVLPKDVQYSAKWMFDDVVYPNKSVRIPATRPGRYTATLRTTTQYGCSSIDSVSVDIFTRPSAEFIIGDTAQILPFVLEMSNRSTNSDSSIWVFNTRDTVRSTHSEWYITDTSALYVELISVNANGCSDTAHRQIGFVAGFSEMIAKNIFAYNIDGFNRTIMVVHNTGTAALSNIIFYIEIDNTHFIKERWTGHLSAGDTLQYLFNANIREQIGQARKICVYASLGEQFGKEVYTEVLCTSLVGQFEILPVYPNPANNILNIDYSVPDGGAVSFEIESATGSRVGNWSRNANKGYNNESIDISQLTAGVYTLSIKFGKTTRREQFIKLK